MSSNLMKKKSAQTLYSLKSLYKFEEDLSLLYQYAQLFIVKHHKVKFGIMWLSCIWLYASTHHISLSSAGVLQRIWRILHKISAYNKAMLMKRQLFISDIL